MHETETLTSASNPLIKDVRRAVQRGGLTQDGLAVAEGFHLLEEALSSGCETPVTIASEAAAARVQGRVSGRLVVVPEPLFQTLASTETSQGVITLVRLPEWSWDDVFRAPALLLVLDGVQDPGNAGAIVRAAEAFGASGVLFTKGTVHPHNPKTLRAAAGSLFRLPFLAGVECAQAVTMLEDRGVQVFAAMPWTGRELLASDAGLGRPCAIAIGSEGRGIGAELRQIARDVAIPTKAVESLNAATAAAVLLYEAQRQRS